MFEIFASIVSTHRTCGPESSNETLHEALKLTLVNLSVAIVVNFNEEGVYHSRVKLLVEANLSEGRLSKRHHLFAVKEARVVLIVLIPQAIDNGSPLALCVSFAFFLSCCRGAILNLARLVVLSLLLLDGFDWLHLMLLHVRLLLLLNDLVHEDSLVDSLGRIKARCTLSIPLNFVLIAHWDRTEKIQTVTVWYFWLKDLLLVKVIVGANLLSYSNVLHVVDLGARELIGILDGTLADLLVTDGHADHISDGLLVLCHAVVVVTLVGVLVSLCKQSINALHSHS